jgi:G3E family GTPase
MHHFGSNNYCWEMSETSKIPLTIVTGFLGSGKTTLLNNILTNTNGFKIAVLVNEFGEIGIDGALIVESDGDVIELSNGCICCNIRGDLITTVDSLLSSGSKFDYLVIETTGVADPAPIAQTFLADVRMESIFELDGVITLIDAFNILSLIDGKLPSELQDVAIKQIAFADRIIINKVSLVDENLLTDIVSRIAALNHNATVEKTDFGIVDFDRFFNIGSFSLQNTLITRPGYLEQEFHDHLSETESISLRYESVINIDQVNIWFRWLLTDPDMAIYRMKGIFCIGEPREKYVFQSVQQLFSSRSLGDWPSDVPVSSMITIIGRSLKKDLIRERFTTALV